MKLLFGREPALILSLVYALIQAVAVFGPWDLSADHQGVLGAAAAAVLGFVLAAKVERDKLVPKILGLVQAFVAVAVTFGAALSLEQQVMIMVLANAVVALYTRTQVTAKVTEAEVSDRGKHEA